MWITYPNICSHSGCNMEVSAVWNVHKLNLCSTGGSAQCLCNLKEWDGVRGGRKVREGGHLCILVKQL